MQAITGISNKAIPQSFCGCCGVIDRHIVVDENSFRAFALIEHAFHTALSISGKIASEKTAERIEINKRKTVEISEDKIFGRRFFQLNRKVQAKNIPAVLRCRGVAPIRDFPPAPPFL